MKKAYWGLLLIFSLFSAGGVKAGGLESATVRLNRMQAGVSPLPVLVEVKTGNANVENNLVITVGNGWSVTGPTITTAGLPAGVTVWPGISVSGSSGRTINFTSGDLQSNLTYGFFITGGISSNPVGGGEADWKWALQTGGMTNLVEEDMVTSDQLQIAGVVGANPGDFQLALDSSASGVLSQNQEADFTVTYGSYLKNYTKPLVLTVQWTDGTVSGSPAATEEIADYLVGSAGNAWGGAPPVIDTVNKEITWTISSFPADTQDQKIDFSLKTTANYTGSATVGFGVDVELNGANVVTISQTKNLTYQYYQPITPTPGPSNNNNSTGATPTVTPTPTISVKPPAIQNIDVVTVGQSGVTIDVGSETKPASVKVVYGQSSTDMSSSITSIDQVTRDLINLDGLTPGTSYYFRVEVAGQNGEQTKSDLYTFTTPTENSGVTAKPETVVISSQENIITDVAEEDTTKPQAVMSAGQVYSFKIDLSQPDKIREVQLFVRQAQVLGIMSVMGAEPNSLSADLTEIGVNGGYSGQLVSPPEPGYYEYYLRIYDIDGGVREEKVGDLRVIEPLKVVDENSQPIEGASVFISKFNQRLDIFQPILSQFQGLPNPSFTESNGELALPLTKGSYRAKISSVGYADKEVDFNLGMADGEKPPLVKLIRKPVGLIESVKYYNRIGSDFVSYTATYISNLTQSKRFFYFFNLAVLITALVRFWSYLTKAYKFHWYLIFHWLKNVIESKLGTGKNIGWVVDGAGTGVAGAEVFIFDGNKLLFKEKTDITGKFIYLVDTDKALKIKAMKEGYLANQTVDYSKEALRGGNLKIWMENDPDSLIDATILGKELGRVFIGICLIIMVLGEWAFWKNFGWSYTWPFLILAIFNLVIWMAGLLMADKHED